MKRSRKIALTIIATACLVSGCDSDKEQKTERLVYATEDACSKDWGSGECEPDPTSRRYTGPHYYYYMGRPWYFPRGYQTPVETRPNQGASMLTPGAKSPGAISSITSTRTTRGGFGSSAHSHGAGS